MPSNESSAACVCGEINTRHCPVHGQGESAATVYCNGFPVTAGRDRGGWFCPHCLTHLSDPPGDHVAASVRAAECAFEDALIALRELGHVDVADRLRERWADVPDPAGTDA